ncbi:MAG: hypothetical protein IT480_01235 [Gammaproteobacteria bacterium]|nr:hypothetical protein [Gammaproteobacteria bacterium]
MRELTGRSVELQLSGTRWALRLHSHGESLQLRAVAAAPAAGGTAADGDSSVSAADARISGGALALLALAGPDAVAVLRRGDVRIEGDGALAERFSELARLLRPDVEHQLGHAIGPIPAHLALRAGRGALAWGRRAARATLRNAADYLAHERRDLVPAPESEQVMRGAERLREQSDRLDVQLTQLERRVAVLRGAGYAADR